MCCSAVALCCAASSTVMQRACSCTAHTCHPASCVPSVATLFALSAYLHRWYSCCAPSLMELLFCDSTMRWWAWVGLPSNAGRLLRMLVIVHVFQPFLDIPSGVEPLSLQCCTANPQTHGPVALCHLNQPQQICNKVATGYSPFLDLRASQPRRALTPSMCH